MIWLHCGTQRSELFSIEYVGVMHSLVLDRPRSEEATIDRQDMAGDVGGEVMYEECDAVRNFLWRSEAIRGNPGVQICAAFVCVH